MIPVKEFFTSLPLNGEWLFDEPLSRHCTFRIGGPAEVMFIPATEEDLVAAVTCAVKAGIPYRIIGNGSNILPDDGGLKGLTVKTVGTMDGITLTPQGDILCGAGAKLIRLCEYALEHGLTGLEFAYGIPGTVGGALFMNAGAYQGEIGAVLKYVRCFDPASGVIEEIPIEKMKYGYRDTPFMKNGKIITAGCFSLEKGDREEILAKMKDLLARRRDKQPLELPSAGSTFRRPAVGYAGALIEGAGLKGFAVGGAQVSEKHAGFVVNKGGATCADVLALIEHIRKTVKENSGTLLVPEVVYLKNES